MLIADLLSVSLSVPPREIERLLDALARLPYLIHPELRYDEWRTHVDFPAWRAWLGDLHEMLGRECFETVRIRYAPAIDCIGSGWPFPEDSGA